VVRSGTSLFLIRKPHLEFSTTRGRSI
jgi:hypothetical protein